MRSRFLPVFLVTLASFAWGVQACSGDAADPGDTTGDDASANGGDATTGNGDPRDGGSVDDATASDDATTPDDAGDDGGSDDAGSLEDASDASTDAGCTDPVAADLNGPEACKALPFGAPAVAAQASDENGPPTNGGAIPAGIYDATRFERLSVIKGTWRETLVFDGTDKFTRTRQIDTGSGNGLGPVSSASGTYSTNGNQITFADTCPSAKSSARSYGVTKDACGHTVVVLGEAGGIRVTYTQR